MTFPFRLGTTSYIIRDDLCANAAYLRGIVDDMQLVLFDTPAASNIPTHNTIVELVRIAGDALTFSLHVPTHIRLACANDDRRRHYVRETISLLDCCTPLPLSVVIVHLEGDEPAQGNSRTWADWQAAATESLRMLEAAADVPICVENIERYHTRHAAPVVDAAGSRFCVDVGHEWKAGRAPLDLLTRRLDRTHALHLHAVGPERDHDALTYAPVDELADVLCLLHTQAWDGVLTLEVYEDDFAPSLNIVQQTWRRIVDKG